MLPSTTDSRSMQLLVDSRWSVLVSRIAQRIASAAVVTLSLVLGLYYLLASPPLHLFYDVAPHAENNSIYVPGAGFSGFWFHMGLFQNNPSLIHSDSEFYCYSSGCLSLVLAFTNSSVSHTHETCERIQSAWLEGTMTRYNLVDHFLDELVSENEDRIDLSRINVLITSRNDGVHVKRADTVADLKKLLRLTTWVPHVTGYGFPEFGDDYLIDGGFSRVLHPKCSSEIRVPITWKTTVNTFNPGFDRETAYSFVDMGRSTSWATVNNSCIA